MSRQRPRPIIRQLDAFAENLANTAGTSIDGNVGEIALRMGLERKRGNSLLQQIRREIGTEQCR